MSWNDLIQWFCFLVLAVIVFGAVLPVLDRHKTRLDGHDGDIKGNQDRMTKLEADRVKPAKPVTKADLERATLALEAHLRGRTGE